MDESVEIDVEAVERAPRPAARSRAVTGVVAAMLVAGSGGLGFGLGRSLSGDDAAPLAEPPTTDAGTLAPASTVPEPETVPTTAAAEDQGPGAGVEVPTTTAPVVIEGGDVTAMAYGGYPGMEPLDPVWEGTTPDGLRLRLQAGFPFDMPYPEGSVWQPAEFCYGTGQMRLTVDGPEVVDVVGGQWFASLFGFAETSFTGDIGVADGQPRRVAVVQTAEGVVSVTATWSDGVGATAPVENGVAVVVADVGGAWETAGVTLDLDFADGSRSSVPGGFASHDSDPVWREACVPPPPSLPEAGEQPADPDAARAEIEDRFRLLWDQSVDRADKPVLLDDDTGVDAAIAEVFEGSFAETAQTAMHTIDELVFTAPDRAWFRYAIDTDTGFFGDRYGVAKLTADGWIFPRALICQDLMLAGPGCDPPAEMIYPPSWYDINGEQCVYDETGMTTGCVGYEESAIAAW